MNMKFEIKNNIAVVTPARPLGDGRTAQELISAVRFHTGCSAMVMTRNAFVPALFDLSSGVAEEVLKPFTDHKMRLAIVGDFYDCYQTPMRDFMFTSNRFGKIGFWETEAEGLAWLASK